MGACYSVYLRAKVKDAAGIVAATNGVIASRRFAEGCFAKSDLSTPDGCMRAILTADNQPGNYTSGDEGGWPVHRNGFDASYSWDGVLHDWFAACAPHLADGSEIEVYPDSGRWSLAVSGGRATASRKERKKLQNPH